MSIGSTLLAGASKVGSQIAPTLPDSGQIVLIASNGSTFKTLRGGELGRTGGVGGWQTSQRVFRGPASWYQAPTLASLSIPCILDLGELPAGGTLDSRMKTLYKMGQPGKDGSDPPSIQLFGDVTSRERGLIWRLDEIDNAEWLWKPGDHTQLRRVTFTLSLTQLEQSTGIEPLSVRSTRDTASTAKTRTITVKAGDTLRSIAVRQLGQSSDYTQIQGWNPSVAKADPDAPLRAGLKLVIR